MDGEDTDVKWSKREIKALVSLRLKYEEDFRKGKQKKTVLWRKIHMELKDIFPSITKNRETIQRKFINLYTTYKRIKARNGKSGSERSSWDFFDDFDEVYGTKHSVDVPEENLLPSLDSFLLTPSGSSTADSPLTSYESFDNDANVIDVEFSTPRPAKRKRGQDGAESVFKLLKEEAAKDDKRFSEMVNIENQRLEIEKQRLEEIRELKNVMKQLLSKQS